MDLGVEAKEIESHAMNACVYKITRTFVFYRPAVFYRTEETVSDRPGCIKENLMQYAYFIGCDLSATRRLTTSSVLSLLTLFRL